MKTNVLLLWAILLSTGAIAQVGHPIANKQYETGDYKLAAENYLADYPSLSIQEQIKLANCYVHLGDEIQAATIFAKVRREYPNDASFAIDYGKVLLKNALYYDAKVEFEFGARANQALATHYLSYADYALEVMSEGTPIRAIGLYGNSTDSDFAPRFLGEHLVYNTTTNAATGQTQTNNHVLVSESAPNSTYLQELTTRYNTEAISKTDDGMIAYAVSNPKCETFACRSKDNSIYFASLQNRSIANVTAFPFNDLNTSNTDPYLSADGTKLYFASDKLGGFGGFDLYVSNNDGYGWSLPKNLGEDVNTPGNERTPFIENGKFLWFSSDYHLGLGGYDIFKAQRIGDDWFNTQNAGIGINSASDEMYPWIRSSEIFYSSNRLMGQGGEDIYQAQLPNRDNLIVFGETNVPQAIELEETYQPKGLVEDIAIIHQDLSAPVAQVSTRSMPLISIKTYENPIVIEEATVPVTVATATSEVLTTTAPPVFEIPVFKSQTMLSSPHPEMVGATQVALGSMIRKAASNVYFVQVAALYNNSSNLETYKDLTRFGNIYTVQANRARKIRVGYFLDQSAANTILATVKQMGYGDAFIVSDPLNTSDLELIYSSSSIIEATSNTSSYDDGSTFESTTNGDYQNTNTQYEEPQVVDNFSYSNPVSANSVYKVRLASYEDPIWFDGNTVKDIGQIEQWSKGGWTIFILSGYNNYDTAELARIKAVNRGFVDAEVVIDNDGIIERLKKN